MDLDEARDQIPEIDSMNNKNSQTPPKSIHGVGVLGPSELKNMRVALGECVWGGTQVRYT